MVSITAFRGYWFRLFIPCFLGILGSGCTSPVDNGGPVLSGDKLELWTNGVHLRGANIVQRRVYPAFDGVEFLGPGPLGPPFIQQDFDRLAVLGANLVNISHTGIFTQSPPYQVDPEAQANLDHLLDMAAAADLFAVISFRSGPGRGEFALFPGETWYPASLVNDEIWQSNAAQDAWVAMWRYTADRYRGRAGVVGYDLMVEPNSADVALGVYSPQEFYPQYAGTRYDWNQLHPRISTAIREVDPDTPILVGAAGYSSLTWLPYLTLNGDARTVYTVHFYEPFNYTHQDLPATLTYPGSFDTNGDGKPETVNRAWLDAQLATVAAFAQTHGVRVAVNEFGVYRYVPGAARYLGDTLAALEALGANHAVWLWSPSYEPQASVDDFEYRHGPNPDNHSDVNGNDLIAALSANWQQNTLRPSNWP